MYVYTLTYIYTCIHIYGYVHRIGLYRIHHVNLAGDPVFPFTMSWHWWLPIDSLSSDPKYRFSGAEGNQIQSLSPKSTLTTTK